MARPSFTNKGCHIAKDCLLSSIWGQIKSKLSLNGVGRGYREGFKGAT